jgi:hypothetical protein
MEMANNKQAARKSFYEVVIEGKPKVARAFLAGLVAGGGYDATIHYSFLDGISHEGKIERISELLHVRALDCHVVVDAETSARLKKLAKKLPAETGLAIKSNKHIRSASMAICFETFAKRYNDEIIEMVKTLPLGLRIDDYQHNVRLDPAAKGVEAYAAAHHYESSGSGTVVGRVDLLIDLKKKFANYPLIKSKDIVLKLA